MEEVKRYKTIRTNWREYLEKYPLILFNEYLEIVKRAEVLEEIPLDVFYNMDEEADEYGDYPPREIYQWYHIGGVDEYEAEKMKEETGGSVAPFYSEIVGGWILPVGHFGTAWDCVPLEVKREA